MQVIAGGQSKSNFEGDIVDRQLQLYVSGTTLNFWQWNAFYIWRPNVLDDALLRGGPVVQRPSQGYVESDFSTDSRHTLVWAGGASYATNVRGGWGSNIYANLQYHPTSAVHQYESSAFSASDHFTFAYAPTRNPSPACTRPFGFDVVPDV